MLARHAYKILGLSSSAREADIRAAWRKKAKFFHPDSPYADLAAFHQAKAAYEALCPPPEQAIKRRVRVAAQSRRSG